MIIEVKQNDDNFEITEQIVHIIEVAPFGLPDGILDSTFTAKGQILSASAANTPAVIPAPAVDGYTLIADSAEVTGWKTGIPVFELSGLQKSGWTPDTNTWSYSSVDSPTGIVSINADMTAILQKGMRVSYQQSQALSAYWSFDVDSTPGVGSFTMANIATPTYTAGKFSNALTLNGSTQALSITDTATLKPTGDFTIGVWAKSASTSEQYIFQSFSANTSLAGIALSLDPTTGYPRILICKNTGTTINTDYMIFTGTTACNNNAWHYIVVTFKNNYVQLYVDGNLEASGYCFTPAYAATNYIRIGCYNQAGSNAVWFNGQIDDLFIINGYALDEGTILAKYRAATAQGTGSITVTKYGIITNVGAYSASATLVTIYHGTDFLLANSAITNPNYSPVKAPFGFPTNPSKWSVYFQTVRILSQSNPTNGVYYNIGSIQISVPIGLWDLSFNVVLVVYDVAGEASNNGTVALSTSASGVSDIALSSYFGILGVALTYEIWPVNHTRKLPVQLTAKTTYYLIMAQFAGTITSFDFNGAYSATVVCAKCAYL